jgi:hypothetical protein
VGFGIRPSGSAAPINHALGCGRERNENHARQRRLEKLKQDECIKSSEYDKR